MAVIWHCDLCGKNTWVNPPSEQVTKEVEEVVNLPVKILKEKDGKKYAEETMQEHVVKKQVPVTTRMRRQNMNTGNIDLIDVPKLKYLREKTVILQLRVGDETIQKDFCIDCYRDQVSPLADSLWKKLQSIESK